MNIFKKLVLVLSLVIMSSCGASFQISTTNHDPIYDSNENVVEVIETEMQLDRKLRDDFNFRYDYAQYAKSQPISFDWNNRVLRNNRFNRYNFNNRYSWSNGYYMNSYWNRDLMWDDWLWGYSSMNYGMGWSYSWNNRSWSSNQWGWNGYYGYGNPYGWNNNIYGWNNYNRYRGTNVAYHRGRRSGVVNTNGRAHSAMIQSTKVKKRRTINTNVTPIRNNTRVREVRSSEVRVIKPRRASTVITPIRNNRNTTPIRNYNNRPTNNSRSVRTTSPPPRRSTSVIRKSGGNPIKR